MNTDKTPANKHSFVETIEYLRNLNAPCVKIIMTNNTSVVITINEIRSLVRCATPDKIEIKNVNNNVKANIDSYNMKNLTDAFNNIFAIYNTAVKNHYDANYSDDILYEDYIFAILSEMDRVATERNQAFYVRTSPAVINMFGDYAVIKDYNGKSVQTTTLNTQHISSIEIVKPDSEITDPVFLNAIFRMEA